MKFRDRLKGIWSADERYHINLERYNHLAEAYKRMEENFKVLIDVYNALLKKEMTLEKDMADFNQQYKQRKTRRESLAKKEAEKKK